MPGQTRKLVVQSVSFPFVDLKLPAFTSLVNSLLTLRYDIWPIQPRPIGIQPNMMQGTPEILSIMKGLSIRRSGATMSDSFRGDVAQWVGEDSLFIPFRGLALQGVEVGTATHFAIKTGWGYRGSVLAASTQAGWLTPFPRSTAGNTPPYSVGYGEFLRPDRKKDTPSGYKFARIYVDGGPWSNSFELLVTIIPPSVPMNTYPMIYAAAHLFQQQLDQGRYVALPLVSFPEFTIEFRGPIPQLVGAYLPVSRSYSRHVFPYTIHVAQQALRINVTKEGGDNAISMKGMVALIGGEYERPSHTPILPVGMQYNNRYLKDGPQLLVTGIIRPVPQWRNQEVLNRHFEWKESTVLLNQAMAHVRSSETAFIIVTAPVHR